jgi:hypothetical protein
MTFVAILVKVTLVLGIAATVQSVLARRASAAARHLVWTLAITGVLLVPILAISLPDWTPFEYTQPAGFVPVIGAGTPEPPPLNVPAPIPAGDNAINWSTVVTAVYLAGVALLLVRLFQQHRGRIGSSAPPRRSPMRTGCSSSANAPRQWACVVPCDSCEQRPKRCPQRPASGSPPSSSRRSPTPGPTIVVRQPCSTSLPTWNDTIA